MDYSVTELGIRCSDVVAVKESMIYVGIISLNIQNIYNTRKQWSEKLEDLKLNI